MVNLNLKDCTFFLYTLYNKTRSWQAESIELRRGDCRNLHSSIYCSSFVISFFGQLQVATFRRDEDNCALLKAELSSSRLIMLLNCVIPIHSDAHALSDFAIII
jgi:hypothetical protein